MSTRWPFSAAQTKSKAKGRAGFVEISLEIQSELDTVLIFVAHMRTHAHAHTRTRTLERWQSHKTRKSKENLHTDSSFFKAEPTLATSGMSSVQPLPRPTNLNMNQGQIFQIHRQPHLRTPEFCN